MILLDTHIWVRWLASAARPLPEAALSILSGADALAVSAISCWEVVNLHLRGRIELTMPVGRWLDMALAQSGIDCLPITRAVAEAAGALSDVHRDPADHLIIATANTAGCHLLTLDAAIHSYPEIHHLLA